jgi:hypothetical protein
LSVSAEHPDRMTVTPGRPARLVALVGAASCALAHPAAAEIDISLYGDVDGVLRTTGSRVETEDGFSAAKLDLFTTSTAGRWSFLAETMFEAGDENSFELDVERVGVGYLYRNWLRVFAGRFHTAIGYYNDAFHHGTYFMVPVGRPTMVEFEDGGGLIPAHNIGIHADGRFTTGEGHLRYDLELANGRAPDPLQIQNAHDTNRPKAVNLRLRYEPGGLLDGLLVGGNLYFDGIGARDATATMAALGPIHEWIFGAHAAYFEHDLHVVAEVMMVQHTEVDTGAAHRTWAAFGEVGRTYDNLTPYVRYEWTRFPSEGDPYHGRTEADGYQGVSAGVKHSTSENIALKAEAAVTLPRASGADPRLTLTGQIAFAF